VFSLALQAVVNAIILTFGLCFVSDWKPKITRDISKLRDLLGFTGPLTAYHLSNYFIKNADQFLVGFLLGSVSLGIYSFATKITTYPQQLTSMAAGRALAPKLATLQDNPSELVKFSLRTLGFMAFVCGPIIFGMMALREDFVLIAFGSQWGDVPPILVYLLPAALLNSIASVFVAIYIACGRVKLLFGWGLFLGVVLAVLVYAGTTWGLVGAAGAILLSAVVAFVLMLSGLRWLPMLSCFSVATACICPLLNSIVLYFITRFADEFFISFGISALLSMLFASVIGGLVYLIVAIRFDINNIATLRRLLGLSEKV
jgi:PST family polysaccharide transporter